MHPVALAGVDQRTEVHLLGPRVADAQPVGLGGQQVGVLLGHRRQHDVPAGAHADLAGVEERPPRAGRAGQVEVGVVEHDQRVVAAQFQRGPLEQAPGGRTDQAAGRGGAGEGDHGRVRVLGQRRAGPGVTGQHVQHVAGYTRPFQQARGEQAAGHGGARVRLEHHRVAQGQRRGHRPDAEQQRHVPRADHPDHTDRHAPGDAVPVGFGGQQHAVRAGGQFGGGAELVGDRADLELGLGPHATALPHDPLGHLVAGLVEHGGGGAQDRGPFGRRGRGPPGLGGLGRGDGGVDVGGVGQPGGGQSRARGLLHHLGAATGRRAPAGAEHRALLGRAEQSSHAISPCPVGARSGPRPRRRPPAGARHRETDQECGKRGATISEAVGGGFPRCWRKLLSGVFRLCGAVFSCFFSER